MKRLLAASQKASPVEPRKTPVAVDIELRGIVTEKNQFMVIAILPNADGGESIRLWICRDKFPDGNAEVTLSAGDRLMIYECTTVRGNGARCIALPIDTLPM